MSVTHGCHINMNLNSRHYIGKCYILVCTSIGECPDQHACPFLEKLIIIMMSKLCHLKEITLANVLKLTGGLV